ncbi:syntaxin-112 [Impatiens glandulifera]|uniref:syntaxin-112 n=1 Tax=Impatiens glandulifera TaxID=253017 RepID=UPI001FB0F17B|nr:syntaxin-112 [Impatiens glandulifera]
MNDLMTKSFLSYVELKKQAKIDVEEEGGQLSPSEEENLSLFFVEIEATKSEMEQISNLLSDLQRLDQETKSIHSAKILRGIRDQIDSGVVSILRKAGLIKAKLHSIDRSNLANRKISLAFVEGGAVDRTRVHITNGLRVKLREMMNDFQTVRERIISDHREALKKTYYNANGEFPNEEVLEKMMVSGNGEQVEICKDNSELYLENKERHEAVIVIKRSLDKLHQIFLDMAVLVEEQGEQMDNIEINVNNAGSFVSGGTNSLFYAKQMKKKGRKCCFAVWAVVLIILLVCFVGMLSS